MCFQIFHFYLLLNFEMFLRTPPLRQLFYVQTSSILSAPNWPLCASNPASGTLRNNTAETAQSLVDCSPEEE